MPERANRLMKSAAAAVSFVALLFIIHLGWSQLLKAVSLHQHWHFVWIVAALFAQLIVYVCIAGMFRLSLNTEFRTLSPTYLFYSAFAFLFANRSLPGPAIAGVATLVYLMRGKSVPAVDAQAAAGAFYFADYAGFFTLIAAVSVPLLEQQPNQSVRTIYFIGLSIIVVAAGIALLILARPLPLIKLISRCVNIFHSHPRTDNAAGNRGEALGQYIVELHSKIMSISQSPLRLLAYYFLSLVMHCSEVATVLCGARAAGITLETPAAAMSYVAGNLASIISVLPGAVGFYEAGMIGTMHIAGHLSIGDAAICAMTYRLLSFWAPLPVVINLLIKVSKEGLSTAQRPSPSASTH